MFPQKIISSRSGFTLIEIIISIAIISILSTVGFLSYSAYTVNARDYKRVSDISFIKTALDTYQKDHG